MKFAFYNGSNGVIAQAKGETALSGGADKQQWLLAQLLVEHGHEVVVVTPTDTPERLDHEVNGVRFVPSIRKTTHYGLRKILAAEKPDWLYWRSNSMHLGPCFFLTSGLGISRIYACASNKDCVPRTALDPYSYQRKFWPLYQWGLEQAERIFTQHTGQHALLNRRYLPKAFQVNNIASPMSLRSVEDERPYVVWVGNFRYEKRPDLLVEVARKMPDIRFVVCGAQLDYRSKSGYVGQISAALAELKNVEYMGLIPNRKVLSIVSQASVFLSTSEQEGFPNTVLEAWSLGVPVVSITLDIGHMIHVHQLGRVASGPDAAAAHLREYLNNKALRMQIGENGRRYVADFHAPDQVYSQLVTALGNKV